MGGTCQANHPEEKTPMEIVFAVDNAPVELGPGQSGRVVKGTHWPADDPIVRGNPDLFSTDPRYGLNYSAEPEGYDRPPGQVTVDRPPAETATAAPGERRPRRAGSSG